MSTTISLRLLLGAVFAASFVVVLSSPLQRNGGRVRNFPAPKANTPWRPKGARQRTFVLRSMTAEATQNGDENVEHTIGVNTQTYIEELPKPFAQVSNSNNNNGNNEQEQTETEIDNTNQAGSETETESDNTNQEGSDNESEATTTQVPETTTEEHLENGHRIEQICRQKCRNGQAISGVCREHCERNRADMLDS